VRISACIAILLGLLGCGGGGEPGRDEVVVFAAASLGPALDEIADAFEHASGTRVRRSYAASSTLAKQIDAGAAVDVFVSADARWMDWLVQRGKVGPGRPFGLVRNSLVVVAPAERPFPFDPAGPIPLGGAFAGRLALGDPEHVPAGVYAREALERAGWWDGLATRVVGAADARAALALVERGACAAGIVYASDAAGSSRVTIVAAVPESWHAPIVYPAAVVGEGGALADGFVGALRDARGTFERRGFRPPAATP